MPVEIGKLYQDQLYGAKVLSGIAVAIIDAPEFQRLAGLRQLGFSDVVYRGARHSRFEHSVGAYFVARTLMRRIVQNHERLDLRHPGDFLPDGFRHFPRNANVDSEYISPQAKWRGLTEVVSAAALLHDLGHVPFGHTLEDEFAGLYPRHDRVAGPRLYEMLFNESSGLATVFSDIRSRWIERVPNETLRQLIYVILSWKDSVRDGVGFEVVLREMRDDQNPESRSKERVRDLEKWYEELKAAQMFHPFMADVVGNTICADLLDYLPRDRLNLGMEPRLHTRLQRYLTIREGSLYPGEGLRLSIMVTRRARGGQRRDVATAVLDIMRERYEMAERVFYHHKKAAFGAMLAKLVEFSAEGKPRDDESIYPAPWQRDQLVGADAVPHMTHLSDTELIDYLGNVEVDPEYKNLQAAFHKALRFRREDIYRTLLVVDQDLVNAGKHSLQYFANEMRGTKDAPTSEGRLALEEFLASGAQARSGEVIVYCPSPGMQSKEVDARLEIIRDRILPLRIQKESFAYNADVDVLQRYYEELWRAYIFVSPSLFEDTQRCRALVDAFCERYGLPNEAAYAKVRKHEFRLVGEETAGRALRVFGEFVGRLPFPDLPQTLSRRLLEAAGRDGDFVKGVRAGQDVASRLSVLLEVATLDELCAERTGHQRPARKEKTALEERRRKLLEGQAAPLRPAARETDATAPLWSTFEQYRNDVLRAALEMSAAA